MTAETPAATPGAQPSRRSLDPFSAPVNGTIIDFGQRHRAGIRSAHLPLGREKLADAAVQHRAARVNVDVVSSPQEDVPDGSRESAEFLVRAARTEDEPAIEEMFLECFGTPRSRVEWRWRWFGLQGGHGEAFVLETDGRPVGHWGGSVADMWLEGRRRRLLLGGEIMVLPDYQRRGGMGLLVQKARSVADDHADVWVGFATDRAARLASANAGTEMIGQLPTWLVWPNRIPHLPSLLGVLAARLLTAWRAIVFALLPCAAVDAFDASPQEVDALAASAAEYAACMRIRDHAYLRWRWLERAEGRVTVLAARTKSGRLAGYAVVGVETDPRIGRVLDLLAIDKASLRGLLRHSLATLTADGCEVITFDYHDPRRWSRSVLRLAGLVCRPGKTITALCMSPEAGSAPAQLASWYLTRGDTDVS
jgi:GNAT superfamily N-acetyltransferase